MQTHFFSLARSYFDIYRGFSPACYFGFVLSLFGPIFIGIYYYLPIYFIDTLHFDIFSSGLIISCYGLGAILGSLIGGKLSDIFPANKVAISALLIQAISYSFFTKIHIMLFLMGNMFVLGITSYGFITANHLIVLNSCSNENNQRLRALNILSMTSNLGLGLATLALGRLIVFGFPTLFLMLSSTIFFSACLSFIWIQKTNSLESFLSSPLKKNPYEKDEKTQIALKQGNKKITVLILSIVFFIGLIVSQSGATYSIYIKNSFPKLGFHAVSYLFALNCALVITLSAPVSGIIKKYNKILMVGWGSFLLGLGMFMLLFVTNFIMAVIAAIVYTIGEIIFFSLAQLVFYQNGLQNKKGENLGLYRMVFASTRAIGPSFGSFIYFKFGSKLLWIISGIIGFVCLLACILCKRFD